MWKAIDHTMLVPVAISSLEANRIFSLTCDGCPIWPGRMKAVLDPQGLSDLLFQARGASRIGRGAAYLLRFGG
jgi:hypothetical protein